MAEATSLELIGRTRKIQCRSSEAAASRCFFEAVVLRAGQVSSERYGVGGQMRLRRLMSYQAAQPYLQGFFIVVLRSEIAMAEVKGSVISS